MIGWIARILLYLAGLITSIFVAETSLKYEIIQMAVAILLFTIFVLIIAFSPQITQACKKMFGKKK